jgi:tryptophanyl-tRNA synthetase
MSKSRNNFIDIFATEKDLKKQIGAIVTDSLGLEDIKNPDTCNIFQLYKLLANVEQIEVMRLNYMNGGYGYGHAKAALLDLILTKFKTQRELFDMYMNDTSKIDVILEIGARKANKIANQVLKRVRQKLGFC